MSNEVTKNIVRGYKVFNPDWTCNPDVGITKQYACPGKFEEEGDLEICVHGMHFCQTAADCFGYYDFNTYNKVAEVIAYGDVVTDGTKACTNKLEIVRELSWEEVLRLVNTGGNNTGIGNTGSGNSGHHNTGDYNTGSRNSGNSNTGDHNSGLWNTGDNNDGVLNTGNNNDGCRNTGNNNDGCRNTGNNNDGHRNTGNHNCGDYNTGDWNVSSYNSGHFNTEEPKLMIFNKLSDWTYDDWNKSMAKCLLSRIPSDLSQRQEWWDELEEEYKADVKSIPNFDADIFYECTGISVDGM